MEREYFAFISYKREDEKWAKWLAHQLDNYKLPSTSNGKKLPHSLRKIFRDVDELSAGNLPDQIYNALSTSENLIVVCSPRSANSKWVNKEIEEFIKIKKGKANHIFPFIIEGIPFAQEADKECFPKALRELSDKEERLGGSINEQGGRYAAVVKVIAGMLGVSFDSLWHKYEREQRKKRWMIVGSAIIFAFISLAIGIYIKQKNVALEKANNSILISQSRFLAEKSSMLVEKGDAYTAARLILEALPEDLENANRPYTREAEMALRKAAYNNSCIFEGHSGLVTSISYNSDETVIVSASADSTIKVWDAHNGLELFTLSGHTGIVREVKISPDGKWIASTSDDKTIRLWDIKNRRCKHILRDSHIGFGHIVFTLDSHYLLSESAVNGLVVKWDVLTGKQNSKTLYNKSDEYQFSSDGKKLVSCSNDYLYVWNADSGTLLKSIKCPNEPVVHLLPGATINYNGKIRHSVLSSDGSLLAYSNANGIIYVIEVSTGVQICKVQAKSTLSMLTFGSDDRTILFSLQNGEILSTRIDEQNNPIILNGYSCNTPFITFNPSGNNIIFNKQNNSFQVLNLYKRGNSVNLDSLFYYGGGISSNRSLATIKKGNDIFIYSINQRKAYKSFKGTDDDAEELIISNDGLILAEFPRKYGNMTKGNWTKSERLNIYDTIGGLLKGVLDSVNTAVFSEDNKYIACGFKNTITIYSTEDLHLHKEMVLKDEGKTNMNICALAISPDSKTIAAFDENKSFVSLIDIESGKKVIIDEASYSVPVFYNHGDKVAYISEDQKGVVLVDSHSGKIEKKLSDIGIELESIAFNSNGDLMITTDYEVGLIIWDIKEDVKPLFPLNFESMPETAFFSDDDKEICIVRVLGKMETIPFPPLQQLINETRERFKSRPLTHEERLQYFLE